MAKKFGKFLTLAAIVGAAAGAFYYYKSSKKKSSKNLDDLDDFEDEGDDELEDYLRDEAEQSAQSERSLRDFFPINLTADTVDDAKESLKKVVLDIGEKVSDVAESVSGVVKPAEATVVEEFAFDELNEEPEADEEPAKSPFIDLEIPEENEAESDSTEL